MRRLFQQYFRGGVPSRHTATERLLEGRQAAQQQQQLQQQRRQDGRRAEAAAAREQSEWLQATQACSSLSSTTHAWSVLALSAP
jgi:hypothetical protein